MTILEAIKASVIYPISDDTVKVKCISRNLNPDDTFTQNSKLFNLTVADCISVLITAADIREGDYSLSITAKAELTKLASSIYKKNGEADPFATEQPKIRNRSHLW